MYGYSSSSDSEDDYYNWRKWIKNPPPPNNSNDANKRKKKLKLPPQQSINRIWKRFSKKRFTKALAVLPFDPVPPPAIGERSNELLTAGYERAVEECRRKVRKIIQECRRVNTRYRDPGWDIDWDLKMEKGNCLNSLGRVKFDLSMTNMMNPSSIVPKSVKRVHEIFKEPTFLKNVSSSDVKQGNLGDCWLIASLSGLANVKDGIQRICVEYDTKIGIYGFVFYRDGEWIYSIIDDKLYLKSPDWDSPSMQRDLLQQIDREDVEQVYRDTYQTGSKALFFAQCKDQNETWVPLIEKAYAKAHGDYASLSGGWIGEGLEDLSGGVTTELLASDILDTDAFWENELSKVNQEFLFGCSTGLLDGGYGDRDGIEEGHAYIVMEARTLKDGTRLVKLRNPWGKTKKGIWEGPWSDGSKEWTTEVQEELNHQFGADSVFWIRYEDLLRKYQHFDRTRLFRDPDWRCCQRWIGVDVPWKPQYHEKFHIKVTCETPLVIVLSQLDNRYFKGLQGQYNFRLQFRVHEIDRPDPEDYIVRSHGNYLMDRSVAVELPSMLPGTYSVYIMVTGERNPDAPSVEDVVKRECKRRVENEKLAQVGYAYDLAHSKAAAHLELVKQLRKRADQKKASEARKKERHRMWEKRHLNREITKKQGRKNNAKLEAKQAAREEKRRQAEGLRPKDAAVQTDEFLLEELKKQKDAATEAKSEAKPEEKKVESEKKAESEEKVDKEPNEGEKSDDETPVPTPAGTPDNEKAEPVSEQKPRGASDEDKKDGSAVGDDSKTKSDDKSFEQKAAASSSGSFDTSSSSGALTPASSSSTPSTDGKSQDKVLVPPATITATTTTTITTTTTDPSKVSGGPPPPAPSQSQPQCKCNTASSKQKPANMYVTSDGESSASPISDWEELYSSDDMSKKPRLAPQTGSNANSSRYYWYGDSSDENDPDPWNAICVVGLRVYSKDEGLELRVVMEGGELEEGGMGEKGGVDLDNAQANAGGLRKGSICIPGPAPAPAPAPEDEYEGDSEIDRKKGKEKKGGKKGDKSSGGSEQQRGKKEDDEGLAPYPVMVQKGKGEEEYETAVETMGD